MAHRNNGASPIQPPGALRIVNVVGARPNFIKIAPLMRAYAQHRTIDPVLVHTGQHYDERMSDLFFRELGIPEPDINLEVGSGSHAVQTAQVMTAFERVLIDIKPDIVVVVGDVNSTIACGLVAVKLGVQLVHVEAGLRSFDRSMPEEINRICTDAISDLLFCTEQSGVDNLLREGLPREKVFLVGNVMIDTLLRNREAAQRSTILEDLGVRSNQYCALTLHRPSNVDDPHALDQILSAVEVIQRDIPVVFPCHPRTRKNLDTFGLMSRIGNMGGLHLIEPIGYLDFLKLVSCSRLVLSDSGGIQEETTVLQTPCLTLRENTERPVTYQVGSSRLVGANKDRILSAYRQIVDGPERISAIPPLWDGGAADRIVGILLERYCKEGSETMAST